MNQNNIFSEAVNLYRQKSVYLMSLDVAFTFMKPNFSQEKKNTFMSFTASSWRLL